MTTTFTLIDLANLTIVFAADDIEYAHLAEETDMIAVATQHDLEEANLTGPQAVALYNVTAKELDSAPAAVTRFADKKAASKRLWANLTDLAEQRARIARVEASAKNKPVKIHGEVATPKAFKSVKVGEAASEHLAQKAKAPRAGRGINLAPMKKCHPCRAGSKQAEMVDMLSRPEGATMEELLRGLAHGKPWKEVTVKSGLNWDMNKLKGYGIRTTFRNAFESWLECDFESSGEISLEGFEGHPDDNNEEQKAAILAMNIAQGFDPEKRDIAVYHLVLPVGVTAPAPHTPKKVQKPKKAQ